MKGAFTCGFGTDNVVSVACDENGAMDPAAFEAAVEEHVALGHIPLMVQATAGTTVRGMYDPLNPLADICEKHGIWLHVDGAWGGSVLLSDKYRYLMDGATRADSITWDGHKMLGTPQQCACLLLKDSKGLPASCNGVKVSHFEIYINESAHTFVNCLDVLSIWRTPSCRNTLIRNVDNLGGIFLGRLLVPAGQTIR